MPWIERFSAAASEQSPKLEKKCIRILVSCNQATTNKSTNMGNDASKQRPPTSADASALEATSGLTADEAQFEEKKEDYAGKSRRRTPRQSGGKKEVDDEAEAEASLVTEDQVHVNLAMADLMAYLQVVANNSQNLPATRRDDPEIDRSNSQLSSEEYARKSAAFIPADVRVIGGVFSRYGRVWNLPTSKEYNASDFNHEPGRSYGGACTNALLKVVYDAATEMTDAAQNDAAALFDDDDEQSLDNLSLINKFKTGASLDYYHPNPTTLTWADLLRKMKAEMKEIEYPQYPKITTTRKIDLMTPFSLEPENFDPDKGKKRSLLIGCNYKTVKEETLKASHDDVRSMKDYIINVHGFPESNEFMTVLLDDDEHNQPTFRNITDAFKNLSEQAQPGDVVFVLFSGHGGRILDNDIEDASYDEVIVPTDYKQAGLIRDTLIFKTLLAPMRFGVTVTIIIDGCSNGMILELPYSWSTKSDRKQKESSPKVSMTMNEDFSFIRFLKVVKTLYEASTFTQLGKTMGQALGIESDPDGSIDHDGDSYMDRDANMEISQEKSLFKILADACSMSTKRRDNRSKAVSQKDNNMFDQLINTCNVFVPDEGELTDEDTLRTDTEGAYSFDAQNRSFDSYTDEESVDRKGRKSHRSRRK